MKAAFVTKKGGPEVLKIRDTLPPDTAPNEVLIRVKAIGLNFADVLSRLGIYPGAPKPPFIPGIELSGIVEKVGPAVRALGPGDRVMAFSRFGGHAEYVAVPESAVSRIPDTMSFEEGAAFLVNYLSAYHGIGTLAHLRKGEKFLIHAAAGGVGLASVQLAKSIGAEIFATASSEEKLSLAHSQGADHLINYQTQDFAERIKQITNGYGVDVVMDAVAGKVFKPSYRLLAPMGRYVIYGVASIASERRLNPFRMLSQMFAMPLIFPLTLMRRNIGIFGFNLGLLSKKGEYLNECGRHLLELYERGAIKPVIGKVFPFEKIGEAHYHLQSRHSTGKVVVKVADENHSSPAERASP